MSDLNEIESHYSSYINDLSKFLPDGIIDVDIDLLQELSLLDFHQNFTKEEDSLTRYFHVIESMDKITLINDDYVIWIVPENMMGKPVTYTLVAVNENKIPRLEMGFSTSGVYNNSALVLKVLDKFLADITETQKLINKYEKAV